MGRSEKQRSKILYVLNVLWTETDEEHPLSASRIAEKVSAQGIVCERKGIYRDLDELAEAGFDIVRTRQGSYLASRPFEAAELKLLVDAVQSSKFITEKKSDELITKLGSLLNRFDAAKLKRQVFVKNRVKSMNESIYYNVDTIFEGIQADRQISFLYYAWNVEKKMEPKNQGNPYIISPWFLEWEDEKYYLIGFDESTGGMKHFRIDKMKRITVLETRRKGRALSEQIDMAAYGTQAFGMFAGKKETVTLLCDNELAGVVIDRFGKEVWMHPADDGHFTAVTEVMVSSQFFGWLFALGGKAGIAAPAWVKEEYQEQLAKAADACPPLSNRNEIRF